MLFLVQGSIFIKGPIPLLPRVSELGDLIIRTIHHVVYVVWNQVMFVYEPADQSSIMMLLSWLEVCPCVLSLEDCKHLVPNQHSIGDERVGEWTYIFRVSSKRRSPTENQSSSDHLLIMCKLLTSVIVVCGIICVNWSYQITSQPIYEGLPIYSMKYPAVLFHRLQGLGPVPWIGIR